MCKITVTLRQHTPLLHFQGDYAVDGATLRATELKPKLDRYIIANYEIYPEWKIGNTDALDYKLKVVDGVGKNERCASLPMYFAEPKINPTDPNYSKKPTFADLKGEKDSMYSVRLEFFCLNKELAELLENLDFTSFFLATNFGTRQSKGYGSFSPVKMKDPLGLLGKSIKTQKGITYRIDSFFSPDYGETIPSWNIIMECVSDVYKCFRSGINEGGLYFKSLMFAYAKSKGEWWDKRVIKERFFPDKLVEHRDAHPDRTEPDPLAEKPSVKQKSLYPMFRDNLGLATTEEWANYGIRITKKGSKGIARFQSPIFFKPLLLDGKWYIFLLHREIPRSFKNTKFTIRVDKIIKEENKKKKEPIGDISMMPYGGFSMDDYMNYIMSIDNYDQYVEANNEDAENRRDGILNDLDELKMNFIKIEKP